MLIVHIISLYPSLYPFKRCRPTSNGKTKGDYLSDYVNRKLRFFESTEKVSLLLRIFTVQNYAFPLIVWIQIVYLAIIFVQIFFFSLFTLSLPP